MVIMTSNMIILPFPKLIVVVVGLSEMLIITVEEVVVTAVKIKMEIGVEKVEGNLGPPSGKKKMPIHKTNTLDS